MKAIVANSIGCKVPDLQRVPNAVLRAQGTMCVKRGRQHVPGAVLPAWGQHTALSKVALLQ